MDSTKEILRFIKAHGTFLDDEKLKVLEPRKQEERVFHNQVRAPEDYLEGSADNRPNKIFYTTTQKSQCYVDNWIKKNAPGKIVLDYACGIGSHSVFAIENGASLVLGIDISEESIKIAQATAEKKKTENCYFLQLDCENTSLPDNSVDIVLCLGVLHHLNLANVYPELHRILRKGGKVLAVEAFGYNPFIQFYRNRTAKLRTKWEKEHILRLQDISLAKKFFQLGDVKYWHYTSPLSVLFKKTSLFIPILKTTNFIDSFMSKIPGVRLLSWQVTFELIKR